MPSQATKEMNEKSTDAAHMKSVSQMASAILE